MQTPRTLTLVAVALLAALGVASRVFAQEPESVSAASVAPQLVSVRVELIADSLADDTRAGVTAEVAQQLAAMASEHGFILAESGAGLILRVQFGQPDHKKPVYVLHVAAFHNGEVLERAEARTCFRCTPAELVADALGLLPRAVAAVAASQAKALAELVPPPTVDAPEPINPAIQPATRPGPATYVGASLGVLGLVGAIAGGLLLERGLVINKADPFYLTSKNYTPPGAALLSIGLTSLVVGTILLTTDAWVIAPRRAAKSGVGLSHLGLAPNGLVLTGRF